MYFRWNYIQEIIIYHKKKLEQKNFLIITLDKGICTQT
jgi:hypothetical protein